MKNKSSNAQTAISNNAADCNTVSKMDQNAVKMTASLKKLSSDKSVKSNPVQAPKADALGDRDQIQSHLDRQLQQRPSATDLKNRNILKDTTASPALQAAQHELQRLQLESSLDKKLKQRPEAATLVKQNILQADPSLGTVTKKSQQKLPAVPAKAADTSKVALPAAANAEAVHKKSVAKLANASQTQHKKLDAHDPKNLQLVAHDPKDYQLVAHDPKDYRVAIRDEKQMQMVVSPKAKSVSHFGNQSLGNGSDKEDAFSYNKNIMLDPRTGSPMSHAAMRKYKKLLKLRDSCIEHQNTHVPVPVSNAGILYDHMQSHKMNALVKVPSKTQSKFFDTDNTSSASRTDNASKAAKHSQASTASHNEHAVPKSVSNVKKESHGKEAKDKSKATAVTLYAPVTAENATIDTNKTSSRSGSPVASNRSVSPASADRKDQTQQASKHQHNSVTASTAKAAASLTSTTLKVQPSNKSVKAASPVQQAIKMAPSPILSAKSSAVSIKSRA